MAKLTKRQQALQGKVDRNKLYPLTEALTLAKDLATAKFDESIDVALNLGVDPRKSDQVCCRLVPVRPCALPCSPKATRLKLRRLLVPTLLASKIWRIRSRLATWISTSSSLRRTLCVSLVSWARFSARAA